jgi:hypothetical protein
MMSIFDLQNWISINCSLPESDDKDKCFVVDYFIDPNTINDSIPIFRIFVSTRRLLSYAVQCDMWQIDATYKLNWQSYPLFPIGVTDMSKQFHPVGWALTSYEGSADFEFVLRSLIRGINLSMKTDYMPKFVMGDAAESISNAVINLSPNIKRSMCWYHMINRIDVHLSKVRDPCLRISIRSDVEFIQRSGSEMEFNFLLNLFEKKYLDIEREDMKIFMKYFLSQWKDKLPGWYEGYDLLHPSTNNGLEATNRWIKANQFRERLPLNEFLAIFLSLPIKWSVEKKINGRKKWVSQPSIELSN